MDCTTNVSFEKKKKYPHLLTSRERRGRRLNSVINRQGFNQLCLCYEIASKTPTMRFGDIWCWEDGPPGECPFSNFCPMYSIYLTVPEKYPFK
jgi:hypothetical protein